MIVFRCGLEGKFSIYHAVAVALVEGAGGEKQFSDRAVRRHSTPPAMTAICAFRPKTGVDVKGHCGSRRWTSWGKLPPLGAADSLANERPALIFRSLGGFRWVDGGF